MNRTLKNVLRVAGIAVGVGAAAWAMRHRLLPAPNVPEEPPARFRTGPDTVQETAADADDLTEITGIGPVYAGRLAEAGITSFDGLAATSAAGVASAAGVSESTAAEWTDRAASRA